MTGRENIVLNGTILGMSRREINRRFDEIAAFSDVERRSRHACQARFHRDVCPTGLRGGCSSRSEILLVDEVLAVGDAEFQKKCLGRMKNISDHGRTVALRQSQHGGDPGFAGRRSSSAGGESRLRVRRIR